MRKIILGFVAASALAAPVAMATAANAAAATTPTPTGCSVIPVHGSANIETFTATQPAGQFGQFDNVWTHVYTVKVMPDGSFTGTGTETGQDQNGPRSWTEDVTGTLNPDNTVSLTAARSDHVSWTLNNAPTDGTTTHGVLAGDPTYDLQFKVTAPEVTGVPQDVITGYRLPLNHGEYVSFMGGGKAAGQSSCGMPAQAQKN